MTVTKTIPESPATPVKRPANAGSNELADELSHLARAEQRERDRVREEALARERERAKFD